MKNKFYFLLLFALICFYFPERIEARLYFMHIPKTGGTTLRLLLELQVSAEEIYPFRNTTEAKGLVRQELVSGHFPYWYCQKIDKTFEDAFKITILRDPVERYLSFLRAKKKADINFPDLESVLKLRLKPHNKYLDCLIDNALCRYLSANPLLEGESLLESAKQTLQSLDCVIFFDTFAKDVVELFNRLGIDLDKKNIPKINATEKEPISAQLLDQIKQLNQLDIKLYEYAKKHVQKNNNEYELRKKSFENILETTSEVDYTFNLPLNGTGWTYRENTNVKPVKHSFYRWVMDQPAYIYFSLEEGSDYDLDFSAHCLTKEVLPRVSVNGKEIEILKLNSKSFSLYHGKIPKDCITSAPMEIAFYSTKAFQYRDVYPSQHNRNHPPLSFAINRIQISKKE